MTRFLKLVSSFASLCPIKCSAAVTISNDIVCISLLTLSYTGFFGLAGHGGGGDGIHHTFITLVLFDGFELNLVQ